MGINAFLAILYIGFLICGLFMRNNTVREDSQKSNEEQKELKPEKVNSQCESVISELRDHITCNRFSKEVLQEVYNTEYVNIIEKREKLPLRERYYYDRDDASPKPHVEEMAVISAILDDIELYDKLVEYLYTIELDSFDMRPSAGHWVEKAKDINPRYLFNDRLSEQAIKYLESDHITKTDVNRQTVEQIEDRLRVFNIMVDSKVT